MLRIDPGQDVAEVLGRIRRAAKTAPPPPPRPLRTLTQIVRELWPEIMGLASRGYGITGIVEFLLTNGLWENRITLETVIRKEASRHRDGGRGGWSGVARHRRVKKKSRRSSTGVRSVQSAKSMPGANATPRTPNPASGTAAGDALATVKRSPLDRPSGQRAFIEELV